MAIHRWSAAPVEQMNAHTSRTLLNTQTMTMARLVIKKGGIVPLHNHPNEQITTIESGRLRFVIEDEEFILEAGDSLVVKPGLRHWVEALEDCQALDVFSPPREDWIRGDDSYMR